MRLTTVIIFLMVGYYFGRLLYVPMPAEMAAHAEFYLKTVGFKFGTTMVSVATSGGPYGELGLPMFLHTSNQLITIVAPLKMFGTYTTHRIRVISFAFIDTAVACILLQ